MTWFHEAPSTRRTELAAALSYKAGEEGNLAPRQASRSLGLKATLVDGAWVSSPKDRTGSAHRGYFSITGVSTVTLWRTQNVPTTPTDFWP